MKNNKHIISLISAAAMLLASGSHAATVDSSSFEAVDSAAISTSGTLGWGFFSSDDAMFDSNYGVGGNESWNGTAIVGLQNAAGTVNLTTVGGTYTNVFITEGAGATAGTDVIDNRGGTAPYTFDTNDAHGRFGSFGGNEQDVWTLEFRDLGIGTFDIAIYLGHDQSNREFDMDYDLASGAVTGTTPMGGNLASLNGSISNLAIYNITVTTTSATDDLSLVFGGISGNAGHGYLSGYTVSVVPEPSSFALLAGMFGLTWVMLRRRS